MRIKGWESDTLHILESHDIFYPKSNKPPKNYQAPILNLDFIQLILLVNIIW